MKMPRSTVVGQGRQTALISRWRRAQPEATEPLTQLGHPGRVRLGVRQAQRGAPAASEHLPLLDGEVLTDDLHVRHQCLSNFELGLVAPAPVLVPVTFASVCATTKTARDQGALPGLV